MIDEKRRVKLKYDVCVYRGRYIWIRLHTTTQARAEWVQQVIEKQFPKRRVSVTRMKKGQWRHRCCLTVGKFYRKGKLMRRLYFDNNDIAKQVGMIWKASSDQATFGYVDLASQWMEQHAICYKQGKVKKA